MSYDLYFFRQAEGSSLEAINRALDEEAARAEAHHEGGGAEDDYEEPGIEELLEPVIDQAYPLERMDWHLQRVYLAMTVEPDKMTPEARAFIDGTRTELPPEHAEELGYLVEDTGSDGLQWVSFSIAGAGMAIEFAANCIKVCAPERICVYDPQTGYAYNAATAQQLVDDAQHVMGDFMTMLSRLPEEEDEEGGAPEGDK